MLGFSLLPAVVMITGAALAVWRAPGPKLRSAILHFAAGVIFSVVAMELLPDIMQHHAPYEVAIGFGLGVATMLGLRYFTQRLEKQAETASEPLAAARAPATSTLVPSPLPWGLLVAISIDIFIDGLLLGIGFAAGAKEVYASPNRKPVVSREKRNFHYLTTGSLFREAYMLIGTLSKKCTIALI